jgi:hypothetical protein
VRAVWVECGTTWLPFGKYVSCLVGGLGMTGRIPAQADFAGAAFVDGNKKAAPDIGRDLQVGLKD